jgi:hypothetical protein
MVLLDFSFIMSVVFIAECDHKYLYTWTLGKQNPSSYVA